MRKVCISFEFDMDDTSFPDTFEDYSKMSNLAVVSAIKEEIREEGSPTAWLDNFVEPDFRVEVFGEEDTDG